MNVVAQVNYLKCSFCIAVTCSNCYNQYDPELCYNYEAVACKDCRPTNIGSNSHGDMCTICPKQMPLKLHLREENWMLKNML
jgi:hypothetical protein